jgi:hypothetical protein
MASMVLGDLNLESVTPSVNAPLVCESCFRVVDLSMFILFYFILNK